MNKKQYDREYYAKRSPEAKKRKQKLQKERLKKIKTKVDIYKHEQGCNCGEKNIACLDFHHIGGRKEINICDAIRHGYSFEKILKEISKCIVICANCHRKIHFG